MKVGFDITPLAVPFSGVGSYTANLYGRLQLRIDELYPLSHYPSDYRWTDNGNGSHKKRPVKTLWMQLALRRQVDQLNLDICHFTNSVAPLWLDCPFVLTIHDMTLWLFPAYHPARRLLSMRPVIPTAARQAAAVVTVSQSAKRDIVRILRISPEKVHVIYEAADPSFRPMNGSVDLLLARKIFSLPDKFILHVGTLEPRKNLERLLAAYADLRGKGAIKHQLVFVGIPGWGYEKIFAAVEELDIDRWVTFLNYVPARWLAAIYNLAEVLVYPSLYEGFGLPLVEAMSSGTPVITSPKGALQEIAGDAAAYVQPEETGSIAEALLSVLSSSAMRNELTEKGLARSSLFSWEVASRQTHRLYSQLTTSN